MHRQFLRKESEVSVDQKRRWERREGGGREGRKEGGREGRKEEGKEGGREGRREGVSSIEARK